ncbi:MULTISPECIES: hypothetical protein [Clostridium]|uniref:hypothetical protein n=1 Tax=Clostridium TaxID=1485 RepID=UPI00098C46C6|nr:MULTISPECIES: hypothetical protein [Clostridium]MBA8932393.1 hypothetical protein [Clostridium beijerinckii]NRT37636.1 hypothetical protein [Clostridium beijerinckii]NRT48620.1 hypothetical protein [Clostridium beijerinckii]NRU36597.1 hypothetical protein [Clostridium beijerinckii]NRZ23083.1 hypothetical protein [Clostridium beijerinckii]
MKKHILSSISEVKDQKRSPNVYYDMKTQVSYMDKDFSKKVSNIKVGRSIETRTIETSDEDCFNFQERTQKTFTIENDDTDELNFNQFNQRTSITETVESTDPDEFYLSRSIETATIEISDPDEFMMN